MSRKTRVLINVSDEVMQGLKKLAIQEQWSWCKVGEEAVKFYLKARRIIKEE